MAEVQTQWVKEDGKWQQKQIDCRPALPSRPVRSVKAPALPPRSSRLSDDQTASRPLIKPSDTTRRTSDDSSRGSRRNSEIALSRRASDESMNSIATAETSLSALSNGTSFTSKSDRYAIRAPEYDPSSLPKLPPRKTKEEKEAEARAARYPLKSTKSATSVPQRTEASRPTLPLRPQSRAPTQQPAIRGNLPQETLVSAEEAAPPPVRSAVPDRPSLPTRPRPSQVPPMPARRSNTLLQNGQSQTYPGQAEAQTQQPLHPRRVLPPPPAKRSALTSGFGGATTGNSSTRPANRPTSCVDATPPPVPLASRPDLAALQASKPKMDGVSPPQAASTEACCLECRDFSGPDDHAARFNRQSLPSQDMGWLAQQLTTQFQSPTDKARVIFTWLHHNIAYDTVAFFGNNVKPSTPQSTMASGLAVCEGYAALFAALALKAGLEALVVAGHGKGIGYGPMAPGEALPPEDITGHAWNAVKIDNGEWKLIDPCWGAGSVCPKRSEAFQKGFNPTHFTQSNDIFGRSHLPMDPSKQFRNDGRIWNWADYILSDKTMTGAMVYSGFVAEEGISKYSMQPLANPISLSEQGPTVRFSFQTVCPHQDALKTKKGGYYLYVLHFKEMEDKMRNDVPFSKADGIFWCDVSTQDLRRPGQEVWIYTVTKFCGKDGRGLTADHYMSKRRSGAYSYNFGGVAQWKVEY